MGGVAVTATKGLARVYEGIVWNAGGRLCTPVTRSGRCCYDQGPRYPPHRLCPLA